MFLFNYMTTHDYLKCRSKVVVGEEAILVAFWRSDYLDYEVLKMSVRSCAFGVFVLR